MTNDQTGYMGKIEALVAVHNVPECVSLNPDTHIFHFERGGDWRDALVLFVNKNGHHFRLIKQVNKRWLFCKTWNGIFDTMPWMTEAKLQRDDPEELIRLCGTGPQGKAGRETLCLLPKGTTNRRKVVWRDKIFDIRFDMENDAFTLSIAGIPTRSTFKGKVWESAEAARWCAHAFAPHKPAPLTPEVKQKDEEMMLELEGSDVWGIF